MAKYDLESLVYDVETMLKSKLDTEISAITTEKNDGITLPVIGSNAYAVQTLDNVTMNYEQFVYLGVVDVRTTGTGPATAKDYGIVVMIVSGGKPNQLNNIRRMFRYGRALEQTFEKNWDKIGSHRVKFKIESIPPQDYQNLNGTKQFQAVGVVLSGGLG